jgi:hypothetical protein
VKSQEYRAVIDLLVDVCHNGQGQIGARRAREGIWNVNATTDFAPDQHEINLLLSRMPAADREIVARMLASAFEGGVFETLKALEEFEIAPFESGYEGSAYRDFVGIPCGWMHHVMSSSSTVR